MFELLQGIFPDANLGDITQAASLKWHEISGALLPDPNDRGLQSSWDSPIVDRSFASLLESSTRADPARLLAVSTPESGTWLNALPVEPLGKLLLDSHLRIAVALRLGLDICRPHECCHCNPQVEADGRHGLSCVKSLGRHTRHSDLNEDVKRALVTAGYHALREPPGLSPDVNIRPDGITQIPWTRGRSLIWYVTVVDTLAPTYVEKSAETTGSAVERVEKKKTNHYRSLLNRYVFVPLALRCLGIGSKIVFQRARSKIGFSGWRT